jgi:GcrA cell cycle regulator
MEKKMIWTEETVEELRKMWDKGMTTGQIAKALNVTKNSIIGKVHRLCLTARPSPIKKTEEAEKALPEEAQEEKTVKKCAPKEAKVKKIKKETPVVSEKASKTVDENVEELNIPLVKLDNHTCRWPLGDPRDDDFCFCGKRIKTGQTYCEEHSTIAYVKTGKK